MLLSTPPHPRLFNQRNPGRNLFLHFPWERIFLRVTYAELFRATNGFSSTNLIGVGSYGSVYRGIIDRMEMIVAIKVPKLQKQRASKSFRAEYCRALRSIQHRNIVKVLTVYSTFDLISGNDFKALVLEYMPNRSLDSWLHPSANELHLLKILNLIQRLNLAIDIACALDYLHNQCQPPIVHCELKPSNILLDDDMVAHVSDFGLATIIYEGINYSHYQTNSLAPMGSIGYIAPGNNLEGSIPQEIVVRSKKSREKLVSTPSMGEDFLRVTYTELFRATNGFSSTNLIAVGSYGSVYRGIIDRMEMIVAIKVLKLQQQRASKSFRAECRALKSIQHRNIVKVFTVCSTFDLISGNDFMALVLEYIPNGSLDNWLHQSENELHPLKILNLIQRLNLAIDIACALDYLHNHCRPPIVDCDLKPSNIFLDDDMVAHVSDFGLAKIVSEGINYSQCQTNSIAPMGSIGYIAPEYGTGANPSTYGDVYSYGILLLEMVTGKRPSDDMFKDDLSLHQFAKMALPESHLFIVLMSATGLARAGRM
ncbi:hypothetical protein AAC387_Pa04g0593 [Persea americana]